MESRKNGNKKVRCTICARCIRSDNVTRHARTHTDILTMSDEEARQELRARNVIQIQREERRQELMEIAQQENIPISHCNDASRSLTSTTLDTTNLEEELLQDNQDYLDKIELGRQIIAIIEKGTVKEESLTKHRKDALYLYRKQRSGRGTTHSELRQWQQELMEMIATPTEREIIWVQGMRGNEGKSWFQEYLASFYGHARVIQLDLKMKTSNILHALTKQPLSSIDIFLFNEPRAKNHEVCNYSILESVKDGIAVASKYNNDVVHFKVPNIVVVFSNARPKMKQLSRDRWRVLRITKSGLNNITNALWKSQKEAKRPHTRTTYNSEEEQEDWSW